MKKQLWMLGLCAVLLCLGPAALSADQNAGEQSADTSGRRATAGGLWDGYGRTAPTGII